MKKAKLIVGKSRNAQDEIVKNITSQYSSDSLIFIKSNKINWSLANPFDCTEKTKVIIVDWVGQEINLVELFNNWIVDGICGKYHPQILIILPNAVTANDFVVGASHSRRFDIIQS